MFKKGTSVKAVKKKLLDFPWLNWTGEKHFKSGEVNLYYRCNNGDRITFYFDAKGKYIAGERLTENYSCVSEF